MFRFNRLLTLMGVLSLCACSGSATASLVTFALTGTGSNGTSASAQFTIEDGNNATYYTPGYFANGSIYFSASVTMSNIPGGGPTTFTSNLGDVNSTLFHVDGNGQHFIGPFGSHNFGPPDQHHYDFQPSQPGYPSSYTYLTDLYYDGQHRDLITWSPATIISTPEPGSWALLLTGAAALMVSLRRRHRPRQKLAPNVRG